MYAQRRIVDVSLMLHRTYLAFAHDLPYATLIPVVGKQQEAVLNLGNRIEALSGAPVILPSRI